MRSQTASAIAKDKVRSILDGDRIWNAYAQADLSTPWSEHSDWMLEASSLLLIYRGFSPPLLFATGEPDELSILFMQIDPGSYWYTLRPTDFEMVRGRANSLTRARMWRMVLNEGASIRTAGEVSRLSVSDQERIERLFAQHPDRPDAFHPAQIEYGAYYGVFDGAELVSVAGTHVLDQASSVAALGNVFTAPQHRGRGFATATSAAVLSYLVELGIGTIVLNVEMSNQPAIDLYRKLGFMPYCGFYEGVFELQ